MCVCVCVCASDGVCVCVCVVRVRVNRINVVHKCEQKGRLNKEVESKGKRERKRYVSEGKGRRLRSG
ncbi:hypothetical protein K492DRAFT_19112 [Lichtheimia hyalospora FSU 10163]|nr:hypothetical protein K492DRAFT_19112 [Lichtheimia hyalospora FSU 10163]